MSRTCTISAHNGSQVCRQHNLRNEKVVSNEPHINPMKPHETWVDETERHAYQRIFGRAQKLYNENQKRADRQIEDYYKQVQNDAKKHTAYEMIIGVYPSNENEISVSEQREILKEFVSTWKERNPNLEMIGAYYHFDEESKSPHVHIDYIPVAQCDRGMRLQNGLNRALEQMGYKTNSISYTAQMKWQQAQRDYIKQLCRERGIEVLQPRQEKEHKSTELYKLEKQIEERKMELNILEQIEPKNDIIKTNFMGKITNQEEVREYIQRLENQVNYYEKTNNTLREANEMLSKANATRTDAKRIDTLKKLEIEEFDRKKAKLDEKLHTYRRILDKNDIPDPYRKQQRGNDLHL